MLRKIILRSVFLFFILFPVLAFAHPLGMKAFGNRLFLYLYPDRIECEYILEIPTSVLASRVMEYKMENSIEDFSEADSEIFNREMLGILKSNIQLFVDGKRRGWVNDPTFKDETGKGDLNFFEYRLKLVSMLPDTANETEYSLEVVNRNFEDFKSVYLNSVVAEKGVKVEKTNLPGAMEWSSDYSYRRAKVDFKLDRLWGVVTKFGGADLKKERAPGKLTRLIYEKNLTFSFILIALCTAFFFGAVHALSPGHGKTLVSAYLIGSKGRYIHAVILGLVVTVTHTSVVFILGFIFLLFSDRWLPEEFTPYMGMASAAIIIVMGAYILYTKWRDYRSGHHHEHHHEKQVSGATAGKSSFGIKSLVAMGIGGGMVPCPTAIVFMLIAISIGRVGWGLWLVMAFSLGLAFVLILIGILVVGAAGVLKRFDAEGRVWRILPLVSAIVLIIIGFALMIASYRVLA